MQGRTGYLGIHYPVLEGVRGRTGYLGIQYPVLEGVRGRTGYLGIVSSIRGRTGAYWLPLHTGHSIHTLYTVLGGVLAS